MNEQRMPVSAIETPAVIVYMDIAPEKRLRIGDRLEIIPNNATLSISTQEKIYGVRQGMVERIFEVAGRKGRTPDK